MIEYVLENGPFWEGCVGRTEESKPTDKPVSQNTIGNVINELIEEGAIAKIRGEYAYVPEYDTDPSDFPILGIAKQIDVRLCPPEGLLFLEVSNNAASMVAEYINAFFSNGEVKAIPLGNIVMCIGVSRSCIYTDSLNHNSVSDQLLRLKIETILEPFNLLYPQLKDSSLQTFGYMSVKNEGLKCLYKDIARHSATNENGLDQEKYEKLCSKYTTLLPRITERMGKMAADEREEVDEELWKSLIYEIREFTEGMSLEENADFGVDLEDLYPGLLAEMDKEDGVYEE